MAQLEQAAAAAAAQDPGKVDVTSAAGAANPDIMGAPESAVQGAHEARAVADKPAPSLAGDDVQATEEEQADYERAMKGLHTVLYGNERTSDSIVDMLQPADKIGSVVKASMLVVQQLDQKMDLDEGVIAEVTVDAADRVIEMAERAKGMEFSEKEAQAVAGATWEGVMEMFGVDEQEYAELTQGMSDDDLKGYEQQYKQFLEG